MLHGQIDFVSNYGTFNSKYDFYQKFNYAVQQQTDLNYFRIYYQDFELLKTLSCGNLENKFYLYAIYTSINANSGYAYVQYGFMYNFYVDIHIDLNTNEIIFDSISSFKTDFPSFKTTTSSRFDRTPSWSYWSWNFPFIDSYNNFALPYTIDETLKADFFRGVGSFSIASYNAYPNETKMIHSESTPIDSLITHYTGDLVSEDTGGEDDGESGDDTGSNVDLKPIEDKLEGIGGILDNILEDLEEFKNGVLDSDDTPPSGPDSSTLDDLEDKESSLTGVLNTDGLSVTIDDNANTTIWYFITEFITLNDDVFNLYITMLTLGVVILILKR